MFVGAHTASLHWLKSVACPGTVQAPPGHCELLVQLLPGHCDVTVHAIPTLLPPAHVKLHGTPALVPLTQRRPPQTVAPTAVQSAFVPHDSG